MISVGRQHFNHFFVWRHLDSGYALIMQFLRYKSSNFVVTSDLTERQSKQVRMIAVGVGSGINNNELMEIADGKRENVVHVDKFDELFRNENNVLFASCEPGKSAIRDYV